MQVVCTCLKKNATYQKYDCCMVKDGALGRFPKDGSDWHHRALTKGKTTTRIQIWQTRMKVVVDLDSFRVFHCTCIIKTSMAGLMNTNNAGYYHWLEIFALMTTGYNFRNLSFVIFLLWKYHPFQLSWYQTVVFYFPSDTTPYFLYKLKLSCYYQTVLNALNIYRVQNCKYLYIQKKKWELCEEEPATVSAWIA